MSFFTIYYLKIWVCQKMALSLKLLLFNHDLKENRLIINVILMVELTVKTFRF